MKIEWATAMSRVCSYCGAEPRRACVILNGNRRPIYARTHDGHAAPAHMARAVVWEDTDMVRPCGDCGAPPRSACVTPSGRMALRPHASRRASSRLASTGWGVVHVRNPANGSRALCGVRVLPYDPTGEHWTVDTGATVTVGQPTCKPCRIVEHHLARRDGRHDAVVPSAGQHATA